MSYAQRSKKPGFSPNLRVIANNFREKPGFIAQPLLLTHGDRNIVKNIKKIVPNSFKNMTFEFDHLFIFTDLGAPEADRLSSFGLAEGRSRIHHGQGTTNRCFFFHNAMLELLWIHGFVY